MVRKLDFSQSLIFNPLKKSSILAFLTIFICSLTTTASPLTVKQILAEFEGRGFSFVYSVSVLDIDTVIDWPSVDFEINLLNQQLNNIGLMAYKLRNRTWAITLDDGSHPPNRSKAQLDQALLGDIENIVVTASLYEVYGRQNTSYKYLDSSQLEQSPAFAGDAVRIIHRLPGAATLGVSSRPNIRGGNENELLVLFDDVELINPFHLRDFQSLFSTFNPGTIRNIDYFTGGFPAQYGNRMSGVMDISIQDNFKPSGGELAISTLSMSALFFGETLENEWLFSARRGNLDLLLDVVNPSLGKPKYHDLFGKIGRKFDAVEFSINGFSFEDDIIFTTDEETVVSKIENRYLWLQSKYNFLEKWSGQTLVSFGKITSDRHGETTLEELSVGTIRDLQDLDIITIKQLFDWRGSNSLKISFGASFSQVAVDYDTMMDVVKGPLASVLHLPREVFIDLQTHIEEKNSDVHATLRYKISDYFTLQTGLRYDFQSYGASGSDTQISPRISLLVQAASRLLLRFSYGRFHQPQSLYELKTIDGETGFFPTQRSDHWIAAAEYELNRFSKFEAEIFYKAMDMLKPRYENLFNPYLLLPEMQPDRFTINASRAYAKGIELTYSGTYDAFEWNLNYSYSRVQEKEQGRWIDRRWDQPHSFNSRLTWNPGNFKLGLNAAWHSGWRYTTLPASLELAEDQGIVSIRSNRRLKDFSTVDLRIAYQYLLPASTLSVFLEATNVLNRNNEAGVEYEIIEEDDVFLLDEVDLEPVFPLVALIGLVWRF